MIQFRFALMLGSVLVFAAGSKAAPLPKELKQGDPVLIVGTWKLIESGSGVGAARPGDGSSWLFDTEGKAAIIRADGKIDGSIKFTIDPGVNPKHFDWMPSWGNYRGCYTLDGDKLVLYLRSGERENRAKEAKPATNVKVYSFERSK